jgi:hypothetical protein
MEIVLRHVPSNENANFVFWFPGVVAVASIILRQ